MNTKHAFAMLILMIGYVNDAAFIGDRGVGLLRKGQALTVPSRIVGLIVALLARAVLRSRCVCAG